MAKTPKIFVACLSAFNSAILHGKWIDANKDEDDIMEEIQKMLKNSPMSDAEEWFINNYKGFCNIIIHSYDIETISHVAQNIVKYGEAYAYYVSDIGNIDDEIERFQKAFKGEFKNKEDFAYQKLCKCNNIPEFLYTYIDYERYARDILVNDYSYISTETGRIFVYQR